MHHIFAPGFLCFCHDRPARRCAVGHVSLISRDSTLGTGWQLEKYQQYGRLCAKLSPHRGRARHCSRSCSERWSRRASTYCYEWLESTSRGVLAPWALRPDQFFTNATSYHSVLWSFLCAGMRFSRPNHVSWQNYIFVKTHQHNMNSI
jgi:hypothetical protein